MCGLELFIVILILKSANGVNVKFKNLMLSELFKSGVSVVAFAKYK